MTIKRNYVVKFGTNGVLFEEVVGNLFCGFDCDIRLVPHTCVSGSIVGNCLVT